MYRCSTAIVWLSYMIQLLIKSVYLSFHISARQQFIVYSPRYYSILWIVVYSIDRAPSELVGKLFLFAKVFQFVNPPPQVSRSVRNPMHLFNGVKVDTFERGRWLLNSSSARRVLLGVRFGGRRVFNLFQTGFEIRRSNLTLGRTTTTAVDAQ